jgi:hypothetical protein
MNGPLRCIYNGGENALQDLKVERLAVLGLDAHLKSPLAAVRSLGRRGIRIDPLVLALLSRRYRCRARAIKEFVSPPSPRTLAVFDTRDIKPSFAQPLYVVSSSLKNQFARRRRAKDVSTEPDSRPFDWLS